MTNPEQFTNSGPVTNLDQIKVWVVAIQKYKEGGGLDIKASIGTRALNLATVFKEKGVRPENIVLSVSLPEEYSDKLTELVREGYQKTDGTKKGITTALELLKQRDVKEEDVLFVYWVGHGVKEGMSHLLLTEESRFDSPDTINLNTLLTHLRKKVFARRQACFFDCCAQILSPGSAQYSLDTKDETVTHQPCYFAASSAEQAAADDTRPGFSSTITAAFRDAEPFPPDFGPLFDLLKRKFDQLKESGELRTNPVMIPDPGKPWRIEWPELPPPPPLRWKFPTAAIAVVVIAYLAYSSQKVNTQWTWTIKESSLSACRQSGNLTICELRPTNMEGKDFRFYAFDGDFVWTPEVESLTWSLYEPAGIRVAHFDIFFPKLAGGSGMVQYCRFAICETKSLKHEVFSNGHFEESKKGVTVRLEMRQQTKDLLACLTFTPPNDGKSYSTKAGLLWTIDYRFEAAGSRWARSAILKGVTGPANNALVFTAGSGDPIKGKNGEELTKLCPG